MARVYTLLVMVYTNRPLVELKTQSQLVFITTIMHKAGAAC